MKVDLWLARLDDLQEENGSLLSGEEQGRAARYIHEKYQKHFIKRRSILRKLLGSYLELNPKEIVIKTTELGKPFVVNKGVDIFFNTSHSKDHVLYGFSRDADLGIDIEYLDDEIEAELISSHFFSSDEISVIRNAEERLKSAAFFRHWCIKEAYIKLVGKGLTFPLDQVLVKDVWNNPRIEIPLKYPTQDISSLTVHYSEMAKNFGIGVAVTGSELEVEYRIYR